LPPADEIRITGKLKLRGQPKTRKKKFKSRRGEKNIGNKSEKDRVLERQGEGYHSAILGSRDFRGASKMEKDNHRVGVQSAGVGREKGKSRARMKKSTPVSPRKGRRFWNAS